MTAFFWFLVSISLVAARPQTIFDMAFEDIVQPRDPSTKIPGATPSNTYPLFIHPLSFVPAIADPQAFLSTAPLSLFAHSRIPGAVPLFRPLQDFSFVQFVQVRPGFYLSEPNIRRPYEPEEELQFTKVAAPEPGFVPIRDAHVPRKPVQEIDSQPPTIEAEDEKKVVRVVHFPSAIGGDSMDLRDTDDSLPFSAPGGIVKSGQPHITFEMFQNAKASHNLRSPSSDLIRESGKGPDIIEV